MSKKRKQKISFMANKRVTKPVKVEFYTKTGKRVFFKANKKITKPVRVEFYVKSKKKKK